MKITLYEFSRLPENEQYNIVFNTGTFIDHFVTDRQKLSLFAVEDFFVEVEYSSEQNKVIDIKTSKTGRELFKYSPIKLNEFNL